MKRDNFVNSVILVTGILRNEKGEILLIRRSKNNKNLIGYWQLPEGKIDIEEQPLQALIRELKEELRYNIIKAKLITVNSTIVSLQKKTYRLIRIIFAVEWKGKMILDIEHDTFQWIDIKKALSITNLVGGTKEILQALV